MWNITITGILRYHTGSVPRSAVLEVCPVQHEQAHEEADGESISMSSCVFRQLDLAHPFGYTPPAPIFHCESHPDGQVLSHVRINLAQHRAFTSPMLLSSAAGGTVQEQEARHELVCDFPATAPSRDGKECRFVYAVTSNEPNRAFPFQVLRARARLMHAPNHMGVSVCQVKSSHSFYPPLPFGHVMCACLRSTLVPSMRPWGCPLRPRKSWALGIRCEAPVNQLRPLQWLSCRAVRVCESSVVRGNDDIGCRPRFWHLHF